MSLRIIGGEYRRRKLRTNPGRTTRPITDRMKETLFEVLPGIDGQRVADVFAGTGTLGLECLSRGANSTVFLEYDRQAFGILRENVGIVGAEDRSLCWRVDVCKTSFRPKGVDGYLPYSLVFFDPPYPMATDLSSLHPLGASLKRLARDSVTTDDVVLVVRTPNEYPLRLAAQWIEVDRLQISSSRISLCHKSGLEVAKSSPGD